MDRATLLRSITARVETLLDFLEQAGTPGNIVVAIHRDSRSVKKVSVTTEEHWTLSSDNNRIGN